MTCIARTIFTSFSASVHHDVGIRMRRLRGLESASAATQAQGTAPGLLVDDRPLSALTPSCNAFGRSRFVSFVRSRFDAGSILLYRAFYLSCFAYLSLLFSPRGNRSILRPSLSSNHSTRYAFLVNSPSLRIQTLPEYFDR